MDPSLTGVTPTISAPAQMYHVVTALWGAEFIELFLDVCVPNQLSQGNLPALPPGSRYRIFTGSADHAMLAASPRLDDVRRVLPVDIVKVDLTELDPQANPNTYKMMTACHRRAVADAAVAEAALIFLAPDFVLGEGTIAGLVRIHTGGTRAILSANLRLSRESFLAAWMEYDGVRALAPRDFVRLGMRHLHPGTESLMIEGPSTNEFPTAIYWPVRSGEVLDGILVRALHLHPLLLDPVLRSTQPDGTIDGHYVMQCCPDPDQCLVVNDSDELIAFELTSADRTVGNHNRSRGVSLLRLMAVTAKCDSYQLSHWDRSIRLHAGELDERWAAVEEQSAVFARQFKRYRLIAPALSRMYRSLKIWRRRRGAQARAVRRARRHYARVMRRTLRGALRCREAYARAVRKAWPPLTKKQIARPAKLLLHRAARNWRLRLKRMRRFHISTSRRTIS